MSLKRLEFEDFITDSNLVESICWSNGSASLGGTSMYVSNTQTSGSTGLYYLNVYQTASIDPSAEVQFSITYGDVDGYGSTVYLFGINGLSPTRTVYGQFRNLIYGDTKAEFDFDGVIQPNFYAITVNRNNYKESFYPSSFNLTLGGITFTDDSNISPGQYLNCGLVYQIVRGVNGSGSYNTGIEGSYGFVLPSIGTIILNPSAIAEAGVSLTTNRNFNTDDYNPRRLFQVMTGGSFKVLSQETITSNYAFVRARNAEFNYSANPSFISGSTGEILYNELIPNPQVWITTVGLYNSNDELIAMAKLPRPLSKEFSSEALIKINIDF
jgi:hypothetical protein